MLYEVITGYMEQEPDLSAFETLGDFAFAFVGGWITGLGVVEYSLSKLR